jgi:hypothetical protein
MKAREYQPSEPERRLVVKQVLAAVDWPMREVDLQIVESIVGKQGREDLGALIETACEYAWDHICGEPDDWAPDDFTAGITLQCERALRFGGGLTLDTLTQAMANRDLEDDPPPGTQGSAS